jgi:hypothetical protein
MSAQAHDLYYENSSQRSPSHRQQSHTVQRQPSRPFDGLGYATMQPSSIFPSEDHAVQSYAPRYPERMNATLNPGYPNYDTWASPFGSSQVGSLANISATTRMGMTKIGNRPGRLALPTVSPSLSIVLNIILTFEDVDGSNHARYAAFFPRP